MSEFDIILDSSRQNLKEVPPRILLMRNLKMLYLQQNFIKELPLDFFQKLPLLTWLDLRSNHLTTVPTGIANHQYLENLLLSDNKIEALPNQVGLLPKLKVLQIADNPLVYPDPAIIARGARAVAAYLKQQHEKTENSPSEYEDSRDTEPDDDEETSLEKEIRVMADYCNEFLPNQESRESGLVVKSLSKIKKDDSGIIHQMTSTPPNKILIKSYFSDEKLIKASTQTTSSISVLPSTYKHTWTEKLKQLLDQQEKVLQQERLKDLAKLVQTIKVGIYRNLQALTTWRVHKKAELMQPVSKELCQKPSPPYATDPQYDTFLSREDMHKEIDKMIMHSQNRPKSEDVEKLISDLVSQLKGMENTYGGLKSPRGEIEAAGNQILKIMEMHKRLVKLQETNNFLIQ